MTVREIYDAIDRIAPFQTAMDFDNVGILVGDENVGVTKTLLCLDVTPRVLREAKSIGVELIISHHPVIFNPLRTVQPQNIIYALVQSGIAVISAHTNLDMAYPYGVYNDTVIAELNRLGIRYARGVESSHSFAEQADLMRFQPTCHHDDPQLFDLAKQFLESEPETPQIFYIWGHSYEFEGQQNWDRLERFCEMLAGRDDIFYGTNREVLLPDEESETK